MDRISIKKCLMLCLGFLFLGLGTVGIFLPVLPTTPFLLLSSFFFLRSSVRLYNWLINHKVFGIYIYNYIKYRAVKKSAKIAALILLWVSLTASGILVNSKYVRIALLVVGTAVSIHIGSLKTLPKNYKASFQREGPMS